MIRNKKTQKRDIGKKTRLTRLELFTSKSTAAFFFCLRLRFKPPAWYFFSLFFFSYIYNIRFIPPSPINAAYTSFERALTRQNAYYRRRSRRSRILHDRILHFSFRPRGNVFDNHTQSTVKRHDDGEKLVVTSERGRRRHDAYPRVRHTTYIRAHIYYILLCVTHTSTRRIITFSREPGGRRGKRAYRIS